MIYINPKANQSILVRIGKITGAIALLDVIFIAPKLKNIGQVLLYIQKYIVIVSPGMLAIFVMRLFYKKKVGNKGAIIGVLDSIPIALFLELGPDLGILSKMPFFNRMESTCLIAMLVIFLEPKFSNKKGNDHKAIYLQQNHVKHLLFLM